LRRCRTHTRTGHHTFRSTPHPTAETRRGNIARFLGLVSRTVNEEELMTHKAAATTRTPATKGTSVWNEDTQFSKTVSLPVTQARRKDLSQSVYGQAIADAEEKARRAERIRRWTSRSMKLTERFVDCPPTTLENEERSRNSRGHKRALSSPKPQVLDEDDAHDGSFNTSPASSRCLAQCERKYNPDALRQAFRRHSSTDVRLGV